MESVFLGTIDFVVIFSITFKVENIFVLATNMKLVEGEEMDKQEEELVLAKGWEFPGSRWDTGIVMTNRGEHWSCLETDSAF